MRVKRGVDEILLGLVVSSCCCVYFKFLVFFFFMWILLFFWVYGFDLWEDSVEERDFE